MGHRIREAMRDDGTVNFVRRRRGGRDFHRQRFGFTDEELARLDKWVRNKATVNRFGPVREVEKRLVFEVAFDSIGYTAEISEMTHAIWRAVSEGEEIPMEATLVAVPCKSGLAMRLPPNTIIGRIRWDKPADCHRGRPDRRA